MHCINHLVAWNSLPTLPTMWRTSHLWRHLTPGSKPTIIFSNNRRSLKFELVYSAVSFGLGCATALWKYYYYYHCCCCCCRYLVSWLQAYFTRRTHHHVHKLPIYGLLSGLSSNYAGCLMLWEHWLKKSSWSYQLMLEKDEQWAHRPAGWASSWPRCCSPLFVGSWELIVVMAVQIHECAWTVWCTGLGYWPLAYEPTRQRKLVQEPYGQNHCRAYTSPEPLMTNI